MLAKGSLSWIAGAALFTAAAGYASARTASILLLGISVIGALLTLFFFVFFRDPDRTPPGDEGDAVSPADGRVTSVNDRSMSIFMNIHNVHVNRAPLAGAIIQINYKPGGYIPANKKDSEVNERNHVVVKTEDGTLELTQIAGVLTRRIVSYITEGGRVNRGERIGMIRFGSRVDVVMPEGYEFRVKKGDRVKAGETVIAVKKEKSRG